MLSNLEISPVDDKLGGRNACSRTDILSIPLKQHCIKPFVESRVIAAVAAAAAASSSTTFSLAKAAAVAGKRRVFDNLNCGLNALNVDDHVCVWWVNRWQHRLMKDNMGKEFKKKRKTKKHMISLTSSTVSGVITWSMWLWIRAHITSLPVNSSCSLCGRTLNAETSKEGMLQRRLMMF